jgi:nicotinate-nucleotide adenylyltransferase
MTGLRIGVFGGAFDPPHNAHVAMARAALAQLDLAELRIFPTGQAWHKNRPLSAAQHRLAMSRLAFGELPRTAIDPREILRAGPTYTLDTLRELQRERPEARLVLVMGADQALSLPRWHGWKEILSMATLSVAYRAVSAGASGDFDPSAWPFVPPGARFEALELPPIDLSATGIRARLARGEDLQEWVPPAVARYIEQHHLYSLTDPPDEN